MPYSGGQEPVKCPTVRLGMMVLDIDGAISYGMCFLAHGVRTWIVGSLSFALTHRHSFTLEQIP